MEVRRGALVSIALQGDYGKPRPGLIIQSDNFFELGSFVILPITSTLVDAPLLRLTIEPTASNGLRKRSQIMMDKPMTVRVDKIGQVFGQLDDALMISVNRSVALVLGLAG